MMRLTTRSSRLDFAYALAAREPFTTHGALRGTAEGCGYGNLPVEYHASACEALYVVYSYGTPIAWLSADARFWRLPPVKYSVTTSKHQSIIRAALHSLAVDIDDLEE